jgi:hypothetical protein
MFVDKATSHCSKITKRFLNSNKDTIGLEHFSVGSREFNTSEECWRQGKYHILSCYSMYDFLKIGFVLLQNYKIQFRYCEISDEVSKIMLFRIDLALLLISYNLLKMDKM